VKPIKFAEANIVFSKPDSMSDDECGSLPAHKYDNGIISCWKMSFKERIKVLFTGKVWFDVMSKFQPPIWLSVDTPFD
jgi:hypothetical protein